MSLNHMMVYDMGQNILI